MSELSYPRVFMENKARERLQEARPSWWTSDRPLSQRAVAERTGLEASQLTKILNYTGEVDPNRKGGGPTIRALALIAWALEVPFGELFQLSVEEPRPPRRRKRAEAATAAA